MMNKIKMNKEKNQKLIELQKKRRIDGTNIEKSTPYFDALIIKADLVFVLRLFVRISSENRVSQI